MRWLRVKGHTTFPLLWAYVFYTSIELKLDTNSPSSFIKRRKSAAQSAARLDTHLLILGLFLLLVGFYGFAMWISAAEISNHAEYIHQDVFSEESTSPSIPNTHQLLPSSLTKCLAPNPITAAIGQFGLTTLYIPMLIASNVGYLTSMAERDHDEA